MSASGSPLEPKSLLSVRSRSFTLMWIYLVTLFSLGTALVYRFSSVYNDPIYDDIFDDIPKSVYEAFWTLTFIMLLSGLLVSKHNIWRIGMLMAATALAEWGIVILLEGGVKRVLDFGLIYVLAAAGCFFNGSCALDPRVHIYANSVQKQVAEYGQE